MEFAGWLNSTLEAKFAGWTALEKSKRVRDGSIRLESKHLTREGLMAMGTITRAQYGRAKVELISQALAAAEVAPGTRFVDIGSGIAPSSYRPPSRNVRRLSASNCAADGTRLLLSSWTCSSSIFQRYRHASACTREISASGREKLTSCSSTTPSPYSESDP